MNVNSTCNWAKPSPGLPNSNANAPECTPYSPQTREQIRRMYALGYPTDPFQRVPASKMRALGKRIERDLREQWPEAPF